MLITKQIGVEPNVHEPVRNSNEEFAIVSKGFANILILYPYILTFNILATIPSQIQPSKALDVCFDSQIDCFSAIDGIEEPLEVLIIQGETAELGKYSGTYF